MRDRTCSAASGTPFVGKIHGDRAAWLFSETGDQPPALGEFMIGEVTAPSRVEVRRGGVLLLLLLSRFSV